MAFCALFVSTNAAAEAPTQQSTESTVPVCEHFYTAGDHAQLARAVFDHRRWQRKHPVGPAARRALAKQRLCARTPEVRQRQRELWITHKRSFFRFRALRLIAPYSGPGGTWWAIPYSIVSCESGGSWSAYNPSGASGPYQLLGWGAPYPANTWKQKMANHRIAASVWAGGAGRSNWVC